MAAGVVKSDGGGYCGYDLRALSWQEAFTMAANGVVISR
jgi:hypothetical protein